MSSKLLVEIAPSILSANFGKLNDEINEIKDKFKYLHIDVMDGHFVPNLSIGVPIVKSLRKEYPDLMLDTHLMITNPAEFIEPFINAGSDIITFHREVTINPNLLIERIKKYGKKAGISINPDTDVKLLDCSFESADLILIMSVYPGFGGQKFIYSALKKIEYLKEQKIKNNYQYLIQVDGGVNVDTAPLLIKAGAEILVAGSAVFEAHDKRQAIDSLLNTKIF
ncbi:MAG TPA: ribulose-phosphate 3-epimerase [bacterium]|nr:ribulose-phosphate 3-epimerase [bacterium]HPP88114.1 ribulose-phosphate 3-epimerase [bacterium]